MGGDIDFLIVSLVYKYVKTSNYTLCTVYYMLILQ